MPSRLGAPAGVVVLLALGLIAVDGEAAADPPAWRAFDRSAFEDAQRNGRNVLLLLTAPWNRDHFLLADSIFADSSVAAEIDEEYIATRADVSVFPELGFTYRLDSGLVPSIHFLDSGARRLASFPPLEEEEMRFYLGEFVGDVEPARPPPPPTLYEVNRRHFANRVARVVIDRLARGESRRNHEDWDPDVLSFLVEFAGVRLRPEGRIALANEIGALLSGPLADPVHGGFHRAFADASAGIVHYEKLLRQNAEAGGALTSWYRMSGSEVVGVAALLVIRFLNERIRVRGTTLYAGSLAADVYDETRHEIILQGRQYYRTPDRSLFPTPPVSDDVPVGANFVFHEAMFDYYRAFDDVRMLRAAKRGVPLLLANGFENDGSARRSLGVAGTGNLRDQGDAGCGLLAYHSLTGDPLAMAAARRIADVLVARFWDEERLRFRNVALDSDLPDVVREERSHPGWNGVALRFLAEFGAMAPDPAWNDLVRKSLDGWAASLPWDASGIADLGRAALRSEMPVPILVIAADPATPEGEALRDVACAILDRLVRIRWLNPGADRDVAKAFGIELDDEPAIYLVWDRATPPIRDIVTLKAVYDAAVERIRRSTD